MSKNMEYSKIVVNSQNLCLLLTAQLFLALLMIMKYPLAPPDRVSVEPEKFLIYSGLMNGILY